MRPFYIFIILFIFPIFQGHAQYIDLSDYKKKEIATIVELATALNTITSVNTIGKEADEQIVSILNLFELGEGGHLTVNRRDKEKVVRLKDYLNKVKLLKYNLVVTDITFNKKGKIKFAKVKELHDVNG